MPQTHAYTPNKILLYTIYYHNVLQTVRRAHASWNNMICRHIYHSCMCVVFRQLLCCCQRRLRHQREYDNLFTRTYNTHRPPREKIHFRPWLTANSHVAERHKAAACDSSGPGSSCLLAFPARRVVKPRRCVLALHPSRLRTVLLWTQTKHDRCCNRRLNFKASNNYLNRLCREYCGHGRFAYTRLEGIYRGGRYKIDHRIAGEIAGIRLKRVRRDAKKNFGNRRSQPLTIICHLQDD